jgi:hypothetical protein
MHCQPPNRWNLPLQSKKIVSPIVPKPPLSAQRRSSLCPPPLTLSALSRSVLTYSGQLFAFYLRHPVKLFRPAFLDYTVPPFLPFPNTVLRPSIQSRDPSWHRTALQNSYAIRSSGSHSPPWMGLLRKPCPPAVFGKYDFGRGPLYDVYGCLAHMYRFGE